MLHALVFTVDASDLPFARLDRIILARFPTTTRPFLLHAFQTGDVTVDNRPRPKSHRPRKDAVVSIARLLETTDRIVIPEHDDFACVWQDDDLIAVNKPAGIPCHPMELGETGTLANAVLARYPELGDVGDNPMMPGLLHRIDVGTSGLVLFARNTMAFERLRAQFTAQTVEKIYTAIVHGTLRERGGVSGHLAHASSFRGRMRVVSRAPLPGGERARFAETFYRPVETRQGRTRLEITIRTGVTHQIRCQMAAIGHPIVGDGLYGSDAPIRHAAGTGHLLHATSVSFMHPRSGKSTTASCPPSF